MYWMGIDVGTGGTRALLVDDKGNVRYGYTAPHEDMRMERPLWAEQRPENWWDATQKAVQGVLAEAGAKGFDVKAVGLSGQMHGLVMMDGAGKVIRPSLIWCDQRSQAQVDWINQTAGKENVVAGIANPMLTGFTLPKLLWVRDHEPANYARLRRMLLPKDYVRLQLSGEYASEVSDASGTGLFDVVNRRWSDALVSKLGLDRSVLPEVVESPLATGKISAAASASTGLAAGTPVVGGGGDQACSAVGNGIVLDPADTPELNDCVGDTIITTDGRTLLGADDKAGIAAIMAVLELLVQEPEIPRPTIRVCFNPDEEIGRGANRFPLERFDCPVAFTIDGSFTGEINVETFSADKAVLAGILDGVQCHRLRVDRIICLDHIVHLFASCCPLVMACLT